MRGPSNGQQLTEALNFYKMLFYREFDSSYQPVWYGTYYTLAENVTKWSGSADIDNQWDTLTC